MKSLIFLFISVSSWSIGASAGNIHISESQLHRLKSNTLQDQQNRQLQHIWQQHLSLKALSEKDALTPQELHQIQELTTSSETITLSNSDHPEKPLTIVDIANQAKTILQLRQIKQQAADYQSQLQSNMLDLGSLITSESLDTQRALLHWVKHLNNTQAIQVTNQVISSPDLLANINNQLIAILIAKTKHKDLLQTLWSREPDQFSYQMLASLPTLLDPQHAERETINASQQPKLLSQALMSMAKRYSSSQLTQTRITQALQNPKEQWTAAMTISQISDRSFATALRTEYQNKTSPIAARVVASSMEALK